MKVGIIVITFNLNCRVFILQMQAIKKFCTDDFTIEVVDNSDDQELADAIRHHAAEQQVKYRKVESATKDPSLSHSFAANFAYRKLHQDYEALLFLDHDAIPVKPFSVEAMLNGGVAAGLLSGHDLSYFWPGCFAISNQVDAAIVDFSPNNQRRLDTGGELRHIIDRYPGKCWFVDEVGVQNPHRAGKKDYYFYMMIYNGTFMHFIGGSNWFNLQDNEERISGLIAIATEKIGA